MKKLFTKLDCEFLLSKSGFLKTEPNTGHGNEAKLFPFFKSLFVIDFFSKRAILHLSNSL